MLINKKKIMLIKIVTKFIKNM